MTIKTDHKWKMFRRRNEVPARVLADQFDYQGADEATDGFFRYHKRWYHLDEFMRVSDNSPFKGWHGYAGDSFFSGVLLRVSADGERYMAGTYYS